GVGPDALDRRAELLADGPLHRRLQAAEPREAEPGGEPHDRRARRAGQLGDPGDRAEGDGLRGAEHDLGDPALGGREVVPLLLDELLDARLLGHGRDGTHRTSGASMPTAPYG